MLHLYFLMFFFYFYFSLTEEDDDEFSEEEEEVLPNTPQNKKILLARAKAKAEKEKVHKLFLFVLVHFLCCGETKIHIYNSNGFKFKTYDILHFFSLRRQLRPRRLPRSLPRRPETVSNSTSPVFWLTSATRTRNSCA